MMKFLRILVKRWYVYLLLLLVLPAAATYYGRQRLQTYQSGAYILVYRAAFLDNVDSQGYNSFISPAANEQNFILELLDSQTFTKKVAADSNFSQYYDLNTDQGAAFAVARVRADTSVTASQTGPNGLSILVQDKDPAVTQQLAESLITQFKAYDADRQISYDDQAATFYQGRLTSAQTSLAEDLKQINKYVQAHPELSNSAKQQADAQYQQLSQQVKQDQDNITNLQGTLTSIQLDKAAAQQGASNNLSIQDPPSKPAMAKIETKQLLFYGVLGLAVALLLIVVIVGIQTVVDNKVRSTDDLQTIFDEMDWDAPIIESIPVMPNGPKDSRSSQSTPLVALLAPGSSIDEHEGR
ncbi:MAG TPA: hypothetical protein VGP82_14240 [Ktedonobacterales bacterium]|jgi:uncharacterized protein involved in exopolysaccharide biosynthesis|nr:hypothetical protein [Ktedonobacterales bacterium]